MLWVKGFEVEVSGSGDDAARALDPDLPISDVNMEVTEAIALIPMARKQQPSLSIIAMSGGGRI